MSIRLEMSDGARIHLRVMGWGRPVVFVHGWAMHGGFFAPQEKELQDKAQFISLDLRGHGASQMGKDGATIERLGLDLVEIFEQLSLNNALCVGWSMGAMATWEALSHTAFNARVSGLVTIDMSPRITNDDSWSLGLSDGRRPHTTLQAIDAMKADWAGVVNRFVPRIFAEGHEDQHDDLIKAMVNAALEQDAHILSDFWESMAVQDFRKALRMIETPTLAVHGAKSKLYTLKTGEYIANEAPNAELSVFENSGHAPHLEEPEKFNAEIMRFLSALSPVLMGAKAKANL